MKYQIDNLKISPLEDDRLASIIKNKYQLNEFSFKILQKSIDARDKSNIFFIYKLMIDTVAGRKKKVNAYNRYFTAYICNNMFTPVFIPHQSFRQ